MDRQYIKVHSRLNLVYILILAEHGPITVAVGNFFHWLCWHWLVSPKAVFNLCDTNIQIEYNGNEECGAEANILVIESQPDCWLDSS